MKKALASLLSVFALSVLAVPFAEATSTPYPLEIIKYRVACFDAATKLITRGEPVFDTPEAAQTTANLVEWWPGKTCWVEKVYIDTKTMTITKVEPLPPVPTTPLPIPVPLIPGLPPIPLPF